MARLEGWECDACKAKLPAMPEVRLAVDGTSGLVSRKIDVCQACLDRVMAVLEPGVEPHYLVFPPRRRPKG